MSDLAFRSVSTGADSSFTSATISATLPTGTTVGDGMVIFYDSAFTAGGGAPTHTTPSGWTVPTGGTSTYNNGTLEGRKTIYVRVAGASEGAVTLTSSGNAAHVYSRLSYQNPDLVNFASTVTPLFGLLASTSSPVFPTITTNSSRQLVLYQLGATLVGGITFTPASSGLTERSDANATCVYELQTTTVGAQGTKTISSSSADQFFYGVAVFNAAVADGSISTALSMTGVGASIRSAAGSSSIAIGDTGVGAARASSNANTSLVFGVTGTGVTRISSAASAGLSFDVQGVGASRVAGAGSTSVVLSQAGVGAASQGAAGSTGITLDALGAGASSVVAAGSTAIVFDAQGVGASVALGSAAGSIDIALGVQGVGASRASGDGATSIVLSQTGEGASRSGAAGSTSIVFDAQGVGASSAAGNADGRADIVFGVQGVGASRVAGAGSVSLVFDAPGVGASRASVAGLQQIVFDVQGVGFESAPTIVSADGSASIVFGMFGDTTQAAAASDGGKVSWRRRRQPVEYDEEADLMEIVAAALPMLRARGMLWDR